MTSTGHRNTTASSASSKKGAFAALRHKDFRYYFIGTALSMMADNIEHVISYWLLYNHVHGSFGGVDLFVLYRYDSSLARLSVTSDSPNGGSALGAGKSTFDSRHRRHRAFAKRHPAKLYESTARYSFWSCCGGGLMLLLNPAMGLVVNSLIYLLLTVWLLTVPYTGHSRDGVAPPAELSVGAHA